MTQTQTDAEYRAFMYDYETLLKQAAPTRDYSLGWTKKEWGRYFGCTPETGGRKVNRLVEAGLVEKAGKWREEGQSGQAAETYRLRTGWLAKSPEEVKRGEGR